MKEIISILFAVYIADRNLRHKKVFTQLELQTYQLFLASAKYFLAVENARDSSWMVRYSYQVIEQRILALEALLSMEPVALGRIRK